MASGFCNSARLTAALGFPQAVSIETIKKTSDNLSV